MCANFCAQKLNLDLELCEDYGGNFSWWEKVSRSRLLSTNNHQQAMVNTNVIWLGNLIMPTRPSLITGLTQMGLEIEETGWNGWIRRSSPPFCPRAARYQPLMANEPGLTSATELYLCPAKVHLKHETLRQVILTETERG